MTAITAGSLPTRRRWIVIALAISVILNLFFVGILLGSMGRGPLMRERLEHAAQQMRLTAQQTSAFRQFEATLGQRAAIHTTNAAIWTKIADPATQQDEVVALLDSVAKNRMEAQHQVAVSMGKFLSMLTPEQRATFMEEARTSPHPRGPVARLRQLLP